MSGRPIAFLDREHGDGPTMRRFRVLRIPIEDFTGRPREGHGARMFLPYPSWPDEGWGEEVDVRVRAVGREAVVVDVDWSTLREIPDWDTETQPGGTKNWLTFGWRWQWTPARNLTARYRWTRLWWDGGTDEYCNPAWHFRVPGGSIAVFHKRPYRTREDGGCEECRRAM